jgi:hypothetical protein
MSGRNQSHQYYQIYNIVNTVVNFQGSNVSNIFLHYENKL